MAKISLKKGGKTVNGKFVANAPKKTSSKSTPTTSPVKTTTSPVASPTLDSLKTQLLQAQAMLNAKTGTGTTPTVTPTATVAPKPTVTAPAPATYAGNSIVDYLASQNQASDYATRAKLAASAGIQNYTGSAAQNTQLLTGLRTGAFKLDTSSPVPSTAVTSPTAPADVMNRRAQLEGLQAQLKDKQTQLADLLAASASDPTLDEPNPITEPDKFLSKYLSMDAQRTPTGKKYDEILDNVASDAESFYKNREDTIDDAYDKFGVKKKQENLGKIQKEMAEREVRLRNEIQTLETAPEYRGVSREFAVDQRESIKSKGAFDLANLAIVESAYRGDLETSRSLAQELIDNQFDSYQAKNDMYKAQLAALLPQLDAEEKQRALAIEIALDERARKIATAKADKELLYDYATIAASMGAPTNVTKSILSAKTADEAFLLAAPYMKEEKKTTGGGSGSGGGAYVVGGANSPAGGISPFNTPLADTDFLGDKMADVKSAVIAQFSPEFSTKLQTMLTDEALRDFLIKYDAYQRQEGMNIPPEVFLEEYLAAIGKTSEGGGSSNLDARIDAI